jgi:hypothetical protein
MCTYSGLVVVAHVLECGALGFTALDDDYLALLASDRLPAPATDSSLGTQWRQRAQLLQLCRAHALCAPRSLLLYGPSRRLRDW